MSWKKYFSVAPSATPLPTPQPVSSSSGTSSNYSSFLPEVYAGHPQRIQRYYQYDDMDRDSDICAALDTIADFSTQSEEQNDQPLEIDYTDDATETEVMLLKRYLEQWTKLNKFRSKLWYMFRDTIKNGDAFFLRDPETQEWLWLDHYTVEMVKVDEDNGKEPTEYLIRGFDYNREAKFGATRADVSQYRTPFGSANTNGMRPMAAATVSSTLTLAGGMRDPRMLRMMQGNNDLFVVDAEHVIHLSLSVGNDINWPFGQSILDPIFKTFKQKELLEDSIIIYRVQRAPERRVFYIDVGQMPPAKARAHLDQIKTEIHQRRIPNHTGGGNSILDAAYNPLSIVEDYFFAQCLSLSTQVPLLDGRILPLSELIDEFEKGKINYTYSLNLATHELEPGKITWAGITRKNAQVVRVTLDNGEHVDATPDHRFILRDGSEIEAKDLTPGVSLMPLYLLTGRTGPKQKGEGYTRYVCNATGKKQFVHTTICPKPKGKTHVVHHKDFNSHNNNPENLEVMTWADHEQLHREAGSYSLASQWSSEQGRQKLIGGMRRLYDEASPEFKQRLTERNRKNGASTWSKECSAQQARNALKENSAKCAAARKLQYSVAMFGRLVELYDDGYQSISKLVPVLKNDIQFQREFKIANQHTKRGLRDGKIGAFISDETLSETVRVAGYSGWADFKQTYQRNHKVVSVELLPHREDTGDITVEGPSASHVFALAAGIYVHNSAEGRGSKVETLPGGELVGEIGDLLHFTKKMARGLRIPESYLSLGGDEGGSGVAYNDGKLGAAMIQEYRFNKYCMRLQALLAPVFDAEFKRFLRENGVEIDHSIFHLQFCPPQNFTKYRQIEVDQAQVSVYQMVADNRKLAERFKFKRFLNLTEDELIENEKMWAEENAAKIKRSTGQSPAESDVDADLSSVGLRPPSDDMMNMPDMEMPPEDGAPPEGGEGAPPGGAPTPGGGGPPVAPPPTGGPA